MAKLAPPPKQPASKKVSEKPTGKPAAAKPTAPTEQTPPDAIKPLQLKIPEGKKNEFKAYAAMRGMPMNELFIQMFDEYKENHS